MTILRIVAIVLFALLVPGGLIVLIPGCYRLLIDLRNKRQERAGGSVASADSDVNA